jgi:hypothetical protein
MTGYSVERVAAMPFIKGAMTLVGMEIGLRAKSKRETADQRVGFEALISRVPGNGWSWGDDLGCCKA